MKIISIKNLIPKQATHPGEHLKDEIEARGIKQNDLAVDLDLPKSTISEIIRGKKPVNPEIYWFLLYKFVYTLKRKWVTSPSFIT